MQPHKFDQKQFMARYQNSSPTYIKLKQQIQKINKALVSRVCYQRIQQVTNRMLNARQKQLLKTVINTAQERLQCVMDRNVENQMINCGIDKELEKYDYLLARSKIMNTYAEMKQKDQRISHNPFNKKSQNSQISNIPSQSRVIDEEEKYIDDLTAHLKDYLSKI